MLENLSLSCMISEEIGKIAPFNFPTAILIADKNNYLLFVFLSVMSNLQEIKGSKLQEKHITFIFCQIVFV